MNRRHFLMGLTGLAGCSRGKPRLNVFNWSDYIGPTTIPRFEFEHNCEVKYMVYESNEEMLAKVFGGNSGWDVVFPSNYYVEPMAASDLLAPLDRSKLANLANLEPWLQQPKWDPQVRWSVPYMTGAAGIAFDKRRQPTPTRWADLWDERYKGRITMLDDAAEVLGAALKMLGMPLNSSDPAQLDRAKVELIKQKQLVRAYLNAEARDQLVAGDLLAIQTWATTASQAIEAAPHLDFVYPAEGFSIYSDCAVILRESTQQELAHQFLDYLLRPRVAAAIVTHSKTASANREARKMLPPVLRDNAVLYPPQEVLDRGEWFTPVPPVAQRLRDRLWTEIKSG